MNECYDFIQIDEFYDIVIFKGIFRRCSRVKRMCEARRSKLQYICGPDGYYDQLWGQLGNCTTCDYTITWPPGGWGISRPSWLVAGRPYHAGPSDHKPNKILILTKLDISPNHLNQTGPKGFNI